MKTLLPLIILVPLCSSSSSIMAQPRYDHELPVIADRIRDISKQMFQNSKGKSRILVDGDDNWNMVHGDLHCTGPVYAIEPRYDQEDQWSIVGGAFDSIDGIRLRGIAQLHGGDFTEIGGGISGGAVYAICDDTNNLFVAGNFKQAGGMPVQNIARWDGSAWHALGSGTDSTVLALCLHNGLLYAGGNFTKAGGSSANYLAVYDINKDEWKPVEVSGVNGLNGGVSALGSDGSVLYVGGGFTRAGNTSANKIAAYTGNAWLDIGGVEGVNAFVATITFDGTLNVGGSFTKAGQITANNIARYNQFLNYWEPIGDGFDGPVYSMTEPSDEDYSPFVACGDFQHAGTTEVHNIAFLEIGWKPWGSGLDKPAYAIKANRYRFVSFQVQENSVLVGGEFTMAGAKSSPNFAIHYEPSGSVKEEWGNKANFTICPNLISGGGARAEIVLPNAAAIRLFITDALGREVATLADGEVISAKDYSFNLSALANGVYYCLLQTEGKLEIRKLIVSH